MNEQTPRIYLTLRCNVNCYYCSNGPILAEYEELTAQEWEVRIRGMQDKEVVFTGGEPTLHREFYDIVARLDRAGVQMHVYTNLAEPVEISRLPHNSLLSWRVTCHAQTEKDALGWMLNLVALRHSGHKITCSAVLPPPAVVEVLRPHHVRIEPRQIKPTPLKPPVRCTRSGLLVAPDGRRFHCVGKLIAADVGGAVGFHDGSTLICHRPDRCAPCDGPLARRIVVE